MPDCVLASNKYQEFKYSQLGSFFDANKYLEDVRNGIYPLTAFGLDRQLKKTAVLPQTHPQQVQSTNNTSSNSIETQQTSTIQDVDKQHIQVRNDKYWGIFVIEKMSFMHELVDWVFHSDYKYIICTNDHGVPWFTLYNIIR